MAPLDLQPSENSDLPTFVTKRV